VCGRGKGGANVETNFRQYGLPLPELVRSGEAWGHQMMIMMMMIMMMIT
jgi:hypothetical protein